MELFVSTSEVGLLRTTESLPDTALWRILPDTWNGGTVKLENVHSGKCVASASPGGQRRKLQQHSSVDVSRVPFFIRDWALCTW